jgi:hypothetical protein
MIDDDHRVFHAEGNIKNEFDKTVPDLRDKKVMVFHDEIKGLTLRKGKKELIITKAESSVSVDVTGKGEQEKKPQEDTPKWITIDGKPAKEKEVDEIVNILSHLECDKFIEDMTKEDFGSPVYTATLRGVKIYSISLFEKKENQYPAVSSESDYPFLISEGKANKIMKDLNALKEEKK